MLQAHHAETRGVQSLDVVEFIVQSMGALITRQRAHRVLPEGAARE